MLRSQPTNDNCANASVLTISGSGYDLGTFYSDSSQGFLLATIESGELFAPGLPSAKSMWFKFSLRTTRYAKVTLKQTVGNTPPIPQASVGLAIYEAPGFGCLPSSSNIINPVISQINDASIYRCMTAGDYLVQVSSLTSVLGNIYFKLELDESRSVDADTLYDQTNEAYDFGILTACRKTTAEGTVTYKAGCQSIDLLENNCSVSSYTKSTWHIFKTDNHVDVIYAVLSAAGGTGSGFGIRLYEGNVKTGGYSAITAVGTCFTSATTGYWSCLDPNTFYSLQVVFPTTYYTTGLTINLYEWGCGLTQSPNPKNIPTAYEGTISAYNTPISFTDSFACNALMSNYISPLNCSTIVNNSITVSGNSYDLNIWIKVTTTIPGHLRLRLDQLNSQFSPVAFRVYYGDIENAGFSCSTLKSTFTTNNADVLIKCQTAGTYSIQILGRANFSGFPSYPWGTNLSGQVKLTATLLKLHTEKFSRRTTTNVELVNAGANLVPDSTYQMTRDTFDCFETPIPQAGLYGSCKGQLTAGTNDSTYGGQRGMYRVIQVGAAGELDIFSNCSCCYGSCNSAFMLYKGDVTDATNYPLDATGDSILNLVPQRPVCHDTSYCFTCGCKTYVVTPGRYTLVAFGQIDWSNQPAARLRVWEENWHFRTGTMASVDKINNLVPLGEGSYSGILDTFDVATTPMPPSPRCAGDRAMYRTFRVTKKSYITLYHSDGSHYKSGVCEGCGAECYYWPCYPYVPMDHQVFYGKPTGLSGNIVQGLTNLTGCDTMSSTQYLGCVDTGYYTIVTYGDAYRIGFTHNVTVNVLQPEEQFHYRTASLQYVDTVDNLSPISTTGTYNFKNDEFDCDITPLPVTPSCTGVDRAIYRSFYLGAAGTLGFWYLGTSNYALYQGLPTGYSGGSVTGLTLLKSCGQNLNGCYSPGYYTLVLYGNSSNINDQLAGYFTYTPAPEHKYDLAIPSRIDELPHTQPSQPLATDSVYTDSMDCITCNKTRLPYKQYDCPSNMVIKNFPTHDRAVYRTFDISTAGILTVQRYSYSYFNYWVPPTELHVYKGDGSDTNNWIGDTIYGLTDVSGDLEYGFGWCGMRLCVTAGTYTIVENGDIDNLGFCMQNRYCFTPATSSYLTPTSPDNMGTLSSSDTIAEARAGMFVCANNAYTITYSGGSVAPQSGYTKQIYHEFYLAEDACVTIEDRTLNFSCGTVTRSLGGCDNACNIYRNFFKGRLSTSNVTGALASNVGCYSYPSLTDFCLQKGWYTVVTYGRGAVTGDTSQCDVAGGNSVSSIGMSDSFAVRMKPSPQKYNTPTTAQDVNAGNALSFYAQPSRGHTANIPIEDEIYCLDYELFDCERDSTPPCITLLPNRPTYKNLSFAVFNLAKPSYVHILGLDGNNSTTPMWPGGGSAAFQSRLYSGDIKASCTSGNPLTIVQDSMYDNMRLNLAAGDYTIVTYTTPGACCTPITPMIYVDSNGTSKFDFAKNAYNFNVIPKNGNYYFGNGVTSDNPGSNPSNDFIFGRTGSKNQSDPDIEFLKTIDCPNGYCWAYNCWIDFENDYGDSIKPPLPYPFDPIRNIWYTFVAEGTGKITVDIRKLTQSTTCGCEDNDTSGSYYWYHDPCDGMLGDLPPPFTKDDTTVCEDSYGYGYPLCGGMYGGSCDLFDIALFESGKAVTGSSPYPVVKDSIWQDDLIMRGHTYVTDPSCFNYGTGFELADSIDRVEYYVPECDNTPRRFWVVVTTRRLTEPMLQFDMGVKFDDLGVGTPYFDHFTTADTSVSNLVGCETTEWANLYCNTLDTSDKYVGLGVWSDTTVPSCDATYSSCGYSGYGYYDSIYRHTAWFDYDLAVGGEVKLTLERTGHAICGSGPQVDYDPCELILYKYDGGPPYDDSIVCSGLNRVYHSYIQNGTGDTTDWGVFCLEPGRYYVFIPGIECSFDSVRVHICVKNLWPGNTMADAIPMTFNSPGTQAASMTVNCFTIGEAPGEDSPAGMGCLTRSTPSSTECCENAPLYHKSGWFKIVNNYADTMDFEFLMTNYLSNYTAQDVGFRLGLTQAGAPDSMISYTSVCVTSLQNSPIITCIPPGYTIWVQTVMPDPALGQLQLSVTATVSPPGCVPPVILPLGLLFFDAKPYADDKVLCTWGSAVNMQTDYYVVERSVSNEDLFTDKAIVPAHASGQAYYNWIDDLPFPGINYYRLRLVDEDGSVRYSNVRSVTIGAGSDYLFLVPNPAHDIIQLTFSGSKNGSAEITIMNEIGAEVSGLEVAVTPGGTSVPLSLLELPSGMYWITVKLEDAVMTRSFVKE